MSESSCSCLCRPFLLCFFQQWLFNTFLSFNVVISKVDLDMIGPTMTKKLDKSNMSRFDTSLESQRFNNIVYKKSNASRSGTLVESPCFNNIVLKTQSVEIWPPSGILTFQQYCLKKPNLTRSGTPLESRRFKNID
jgi:hypothetical protein